MTTPASSSPGPPGPCPVCHAPNAYGRDFCFRCGTRFTCSGCGHRYTPEELRREGACPVCGLARERPDVEPTPARGGGPLTQLQEETTSADSLDELVRRHLTEDAPSSAAPPAGTVQEAMVGLADALRAGGRLTEAALVLDDALEEGVDQSSAMIQLKRAEVFRELGDRDGEVRAALAAAAEDPEGLVDIIEQAAMQLSAPAARGIESVLRDRASDEALTERSPRVRCAARFLAAGAALARSNVELALKEVGHAYRIDGAEARRLWRVLLQRPEVAASSLTGGEAAARSFAARGYAALGEDDEARTIAHSAIDDLLTGPGNPEAECHLILAEDPGVDAEARAFHLMEAGRLIGLRGGAANLRRSVALLARSAELDATRVDTYWYWADNQRLTAFQGATADRAMLREAWQTWQRGARLGPIVDAWPRVLECALCLALSDTESGREGVWTDLALRAAVDAVDLDAAWPSTWAWLSRCARRRQLWAACWFASRQLLSQSGAEGPTERDDVEEMVIVSLQLDPGSFPGWLDRCEEASEVDDWLLEMRAVQHIRVDDWRGASRCLDQIEQQVSEGVLFLRAWGGAVFGDPEASTAASALAEYWERAASDRRRVAESDTAWARLLSGDPEAALRHLDSAAAATPPEMIDLAAHAEMRVLASLLAGDEDAVRRHWQDVACHLRAVVAEDLGQELRWAARRCREAGDSSGAELAEALVEEVAGAVVAQPDDLTAAARAALAEADRALGSGAPGGTASTGLLALRRLLSSYAVPRAIDTRDWPTLLILEIGLGLVPEDADSAWERWVLFRDLIPAARTRLEDALGFPVMGIKVVASTTLGEREYRAVVNGFEGSVGVLDDGLPAAPFTVSEGDDPAAWRPCLSALEEMALGVPGEMFVPYSIAALLELWRDDPAVPEEIVDTVSEDRFARILVWQRLRQLVEHRRRLPAWADGTGDVVGASLGEAKAFEDLLVPETASTGSDQ